jgi:hypothetical protein
MKQTLLEGERFIHRDLWLVVERQRRHASAVPQGAFYDDLVAMVFAFHTLEAYLNFVGERLAPAIWADERNYFRKEPYRGFDGKLKKVLELSGMPVPDFHARPYSVVGTLKGLRDTIAHGKIDKFEATVIHPPGDDVDPYTTSLDLAVTEQTAREAVEDLESFVEELHTFVRAKTADVWAKQDALRGPIQWSTRHTTDAI